MSLELYRCFDVHEFIRDLDDEVVDREVRRIYRECIQDAFDSGIVWPGGSPPDMHQQRNFDRLTARTLNLSEWSTLIASVIKTPRLLKFYERSVLRSWQRLRGEISLQELMAVEALRASAPSEFERLLLHLQQLLHANRSNDSNVRSRGVATSTLEDEISQLKTVFIPHLPEEEKLSVTAIVEGLVRGTFKGDSPQQSVTTENRSSIYYSRLASSSAVDDNGILDQNVLFALKQFIDESDVKSLPEHIAENPDYSRIFESFCRWLTVDWQKLTGLFSDIVDKEVVIIPKSHGDLIERNYGWFPLWRLIIHEIDFQTEDLFVSGYQGLRDYRRSYDKSEHSQVALEWVSSLVYRTIRRSLDYTNSLCDYLSGSESGNSVIRGAQTKQLRIAVHDYLRTNIRTAADWMSILTPSRPYQIYHLFYDVSGRGHVPTLNKPEDWAWSLSSLLEACNNNPLTIQPMLMLLLMKRDPEREDVRIFDEEAARAFAQHDSVLLTKLLRQITAPIDLAGRLQPRDITFCESVRKGAHKLLTSVANG